MRINNNLMAYNAQNKLGINNNNVANSVRKLSSGLRISRAGDDAAGLAISEKMRGQIRGLDQASRNSQDAISLIQTAEGALNETHAILQRMRELAVQSSSDTNQDDVDRAALNKEFEALTLEIDDIANDTQFNGQNLLNGDLSNDTTAVKAASGHKLGLLGLTDVKTSGFTGAGDTVMTIAQGTVDNTTFTMTDGAGKQAISDAGTYVDGKQTLNFSFADGRTVTMAFSASATAAGTAGATLTLETSAGGGGAQIQTGANEGENLTLTVEKMHSTSIGNDGVISSQSVATAEIDTRAHAELAIDTVDVALNEVSEQRAALGAYQNRLEHKIKNLDTSSENLQAAESRIRDLDMAKEMTEFTSNNILSQAATSMLAQANSLPQGVLKLLG